MAVLEENRIGQLTPDMEEFRGMVKAVLERNMDRYRLVLFPSTSILTLSNKISCFLANLTISFYLAFEGNTSNLDGQVQLILQIQLPWRR